MQFYCNIFCFSFKKLHFLAVTAEHSVMVKYGFSLLNKNANWMNKVITNPIAVRLHRWGFYLSWQQPCSSSPTLPARKKRNSISGGIHCCQSLPKIYHSIDQGLPSGNVCRQPIRFPTYGINNSWYQSYFDSSWFCHHQQSLWDLALDGSLPPLGLLPFL